MNCLNPLRLFQIDKDTKKIFGKEVHHVEIGFDDTIIPVKSHNVNPSCHHAIFSFREVPCRQCYACRKSHALMWSERVVSELPYYDSSVFITLTYDDEHLPRNENGFMTIRTKDLQDFWKRLRKKSDVPLRYFASSEYGTTSHRPHFHAIVFGLSLDDLVLHSHDYDTDLDLYTSESLAETWSNGFVTVGEANIRSARYVAGYVDKKLHSTKSSYWYKQIGIEPEKLYVSNGIGLRAYEDKIKDDLFNKQYSESVFHDSVIHNNNYFSAKFKESNPEEYANWTDTLEKLEKADRRARRVLMPDVAYYDNLDRHNEYMIQNMKKRGD